PARLRPLGIGAANERVREVGGEEFLEPFDRRVRARAFGVEISLVREVPELMEHDESDAAQVGVVVRPDDQRALIQGSGDTHEKILHPSPWVAIEPETVIRPRIEPLLRTEDGQVELESGAELALEV